MTDRRKLGMCNYCQDLGPVFEQEDEAGTPQFLVCHNCITDIFIGIEKAEQRKKTNPRAAAEEFHRQRKSMDHNWSLMQQWLDGYRDIREE